MAKYVKVVNNTVVKRIIADEDFINSYEDDTPGRWIQSDTAAKGWTYDPTDETFTAPVVVIPTDIPE